MRKFFVLGMVLGLLLCGVSRNTFAQYETYWTPTPDLTSLISPAPTFLMAEPELIISPPIPMIPSAITPPPIFFPTPTIPQIALGTLAPAIPDTGQTQSYTDTFGEDHDYTINPPSYTKLDAQGTALSDDALVWSMVKDNVTGLIWEGKTDDGSIHDKDNDYNWDDAQSIFIAKLNAAKFGGFSDWRLPTIKELSFIVNSGTYNPAINTAYFPNTMLSYYYWSSTTYAHGPDSAWCVDFYVGAVDYPVYKPYSCYVRAVRGEQSGLLDNLVINGDGTVTDTSTKLMWQQQTAEPMMWEAAISYCESLSLGGYDDWRLPNRNELQSIVDYTRYWPAIDTVVFPDTMSSYDYWSSTTFANGGNAWYVYFSRGDIYSYNTKSYSYYVRAVRGGQVGPLVTENMTIKINGNDGIDTPFIFIKRDLTVRWDKVVGAGYYFVSLYDLSENKPVFKTIRVDQLSYTIKFSDLFAGHQYKFNVSPVKGGIAGNPSSIIINVAYETDQKVEKFKNIADEYVDRCYENLPPVALARTSGLRSDVFSIRAVSPYDNVSFENQKLCQLHAHFLNDSPKLITSILPPLVSAALKPPFRWESQYPCLQVSRVEQSYADKGYSFVCITEHNIIAPLPKPPIINFLHITGEEVTMKEAFHLLAIGIDGEDLIVPKYTVDFNNTDVIQYLTEQEIIKDKGFIDKLEPYDIKAGKDDPKNRFILYLRNKFRTDAINTIVKRDGIPIAAHPRAGLVSYFSPEKSWTKEQLKKLPLNGGSIEIFNNSVDWAMRDLCVVQPENPHRWAAWALAEEEITKSDPSQDQREWDKLLTEGLKIWGVATDDFMPTRGNKGFDGGCIRILTNDISIDSLKKCIREGKFYASQGSESPKFLKIEVDRRQIAPIIKVEAHGQWLNFIGKNGQVLQSNYYCMLYDWLGINNPEYTCKGDEGYIRIESILGDIAPSLYGTRHGTVA